MQKKVIFIAGLLIATLMFINPIYSSESSIRDFSAVHEKWAYLVGVSDYQDPNVEDLSGPTEDLSKMKSLLLEYGGFKKDNLFLVSNENATYRNILEDLNELAKNSIDSNDLFIFYFSGHGGRKLEKMDIDENDGYDEFICPYDSLHNSYYYSIYDDTLLNILKNIKAKEVILIFDSCYSGGFISDLSNLNSSKLIIISASGEKEKANEYSETAGVFTQYFVDGLKRKKNNVNNTESWVLNAFNYAKPFIQKHNQTPLIYIH